MRRESFGILLALAAMFAATAAFASTSPQQATGQEIIDASLGNPKPAVEPDYLVKPETAETEPVTIKDVRVRSGSLGRITVEILADGKASWGLMELENPARILLDIPGAKAAKGVKRNLDVGSGELSKVRVGPHEDKVRIVLDLNAGIPEYDVKQDGTKIKIVVGVLEKTRISGLRIQSEEVAATIPTMDQTAAIEKPIQDQSPVESTPVYEEKTAGKIMEQKFPSVEDVQFRQYKGYSRVSIRLSEPSDYKLVEIDGKTVALEMRSSLANKGLQRTLDVTEMSGPVDSISSFLDKSRSDTVIVAVKLREKTESKVTVEKNVINWDFIRPSETALKGSEVVEYTKEKTAGATSSTSFATGAAISSKVYKGKRISLDFKDADIHNILRLISEISKLNIITSDNVAGKITVTLRNVPWDEALDIILQTKGLGMKQVGNILRIAPAEVFQKEAEMELAKKKSIRNLEPLYVRLIPVNYGIASEIVNQVKDVLSERGTINIDQRTNVIIVKDLQENVIKAEGLIRNLDTQTPQVLIESRIVEANTSFTRDIGIQWGGNLAFSPAYGNGTGLSFPSVISVAGGADDSRTQNPYSGTASPAGFAVNMPAAVGAGSGGAIGFIFSNSSGTASLNLRLSAMESTGDVKILSAPRVTTLDNKEARIAAGTSIPISTVSAAGVNTTFVEAKLELAVTPHVTQDGSILMKITTTKNEPDFSRTGAQGDPTILKKEAKTEVLVKDGDTTVIGGIYTRKNSEEYTKVPFLANIPVLGWLFKKKKVSDERQELLIFITPRIINRSQSSLVSGN